MHGDSRFEVATWYADLAFHYRRLVPRDSTAANSLNLLCPSLRRSRSSHLLAVPVLSCRALSPSSASSVRLSRPFFLFCLESTSLARFPYRVSSISSPYVPSGWPGATPTTGLYNIRYHTRATGSETPHPRTPFSHLHLDNSGNRLCDPSTAPLLS